MILPKVSRFKFGQETQQKSSIGDMYLSDGEICLGTPSEKQCQCHPAISLFGIPFISTTLVAARAKNRLFGYNFTLVLRCRKTPIVYLD